MSYNDGSSRLSPLDIKEAIESVLFITMTDLDDESIYKVSAGKGYKSQVIADKSTGALVIVAFDGHQVVVCAACGKRNMPDWLADTQGKTSEAFLAVGARIEEAILSYGADHWRRPMDERPRLLFCGHGLGVGLSARAFYSWRQKYGTGNEALYGFGQSAGDGNDMTGYLTHLATQAQKI